MSRFNYMFMGVTMPRYSVMEQNIINQLIDAGGSKDWEDIVGEWVEENWDEVETTLEDLEAANIITTNTVFENDLRHVKVTLVK